MKILVTGASGFLGRTVIEVLANDKEGDGWQIIAPGATAENPKLIPVARVDITNFADLLTLETFGTVEAVIHCAGLAHQFGETSRRRFFEVNADGAANVARTAIRMGAKKFVLVSSVAVYGKPTDSSKSSGNENNFIDETSECAPRGEYAESKYAGEKAVEKICLENNIQLIILRPATIIGESDRGNVARLIELIRRRRFVWIGTGKNRKSLIYVRDAARAAAQMMKAQNAPPLEILNVSADAVSMKNIVTVIAAELGVTIPPVFIPSIVPKLIFRAGGLLIKHAKFQKISESVEKWQSDEIFSSEKIRKKYGFQIETSIAEAMRREIVKQPPV